MLADGATSPCLMVRRGPWKYIFCESDPPQLFHLGRDPHEQRNLAGGAETATLERDLRALVYRHWDPPELAREMARSAEQRLFIQSTRLAGEYAPWDFEPRQDPGKQYVRSGDAVSATIVKGRARYPYVSPKPPDFPSEGADTPPV